LWVIFALLDPIESGFNPEPDMDPDPQPCIQVIRRAFIGSDDSHVMDIIDTGSSPAARGLSVDPTAETVFYAGSDDLVPDESSILAARLDGTRVVRIRDVNAAVRQVVVVPARGILFWHEVMNNENGTENIMRAWMDGTEAQAVVSLAARGVLEEDEQQQQQPAISNLTYSHRTGRLYWLQGAGQLRYFDLASSRLGEMKLELANVTAMTEHNGTLFFAQQLKQQQKQEAFVVSAVELQGEAAATVIRNFSHAVLSLAVYDPESQQERSKCSVKNGGCAHLCVPVKEGNSG
jgi:hypothetical protein